MTAIGGKLVVFGGARSGQFVAKTCRSAKANKALAVRPSLSQIGTLRCRFQAGQDEFRCRHPLLGLRDFFPRPIFLAYAERCLA
jgi:hypothetical protein